MKPGDNKKSAATHGGAHLRAAQPAFPTYRLRDVTLSILIFYVVCLLLDAHGLYNWTQKLPVSETSRVLRQQAEKHWARTSALGLEEPKHTLETFFLGLQEAHPLLYPRKYAEVQRRKREKAARAKTVTVKQSKVAKPKPPTQVSDPSETLPVAASPKVLVLGDSIMMTVGPVIKKDVKDRLGGAAVVKAKLATGLARPDVFDWPREVKRLTRQSVYDVIVLMFGTNDSQDFLEGGEILAYGTAAWVQAYNRRLADIMTSACAGAKRAIWVGLPPMQSEAFNRKAVRINSWAKRQAARHSCVEFVALDTVLGDESGKYVGYRKVDGHVEKVRMVDGIHVTTRGGGLVSSVLLKFMTAGRLLTH